MDNVTKACATHDCERPAAARGLCGACYGRARRRGELPPGQTHSLTEIDTGERTALCALCGRTAIRLRSKNSGGRAECMTARRESRKRERGHDPEKWRMQKYGVSPELYSAMRVAQDGLCAICYASGNLVVDHCHESGAVRALLCPRCNVALGWMDDTPERLRAAADYLERF